jgi:hypothetical protein
MSKPGGLPLLIFIPGITVALNLYGSLVALWASRQADEPAIAGRFAAAFLLNFVLSSLLLSSYHKNGASELTIQECVLVTAGVIAIAQSTLTLAFSVAPPKKRRMEWPAFSWALLAAGVCALVYVARNGLGRRRWAASASAAVVALALLAMAVPAKERTGAGEEP